MSAKRPKHVKQPSPKRRPRQEIKPEKYVKETITWKFSVLDLDSSFGWQNLKINDLRNTILPKVKNLETMTWDEILRHPHNHEIPKMNLCREAQKRLEEINQDEE